MNIAMSKELPTFIWENRLSAVSVVGRDRLSVLARSRWRGRRWSCTLSLSLPMTDAADRLLSHVNVSSSLLMTLFMAEDRITLCRTRQPPAAVIFKRRKSDFYIQICMLMFLSDLEKKTEDE